jgi:Na+-transporting methylmalonyl-CoA/oxaloacetate decarboxylase gamma subunit
MNKIIKSVVTILVGMCLTAGSAFAQPGPAGNPPLGPAPEAPEAIAPAPAPMDFTSNQICYIPEKQAFVLIDSIDCAVDLLVRKADGLQRVGRFTTDRFTGRHDLANILRPRSVSVCGDKILVLASSKKDTSYLAVVSMNPVKCLDEQGFDSLKAVSCVGFKCNSYAFRLDPCSDQIIVVGNNPVGYDINYVSYTDGLENITPASDFHYHVPKQAERIKASDPYGAGLAIVAISVVFFALICIMFLMGGYGKLIQRFQNRKAQPAKGSTPAKVAGGSVEDEVHVAIAAAIFAYSQDLHDVEDTIITIQKTERAWTPWNAKFYNMNRYFSVRK